MTPQPPDPGPPGGHLGDLLSALLDAELSPAEETLARSHLSACRRCSIELEQVGLARAWVRSLPQLEPPLGFIERLVREQEEPARRPWPVPAPGRGWARWAGVAALAASAAGAAGLVGLASPREPAVAPPVGRLVETHATGASLTGDPLSRLAPVGVPVSLRR